MLVSTCGEMQAFGVGVGVGNGFCLKDKIIIAGTTVGKCWCRVLTVRV